MDQPSSSQSPSTSQSPSLDQCLKLLRGERDEQRLAGLLLVTKFCDKDDHDSIRRVYDAVGVQFLDRLLRTGMGKGTPPANNENQDAYLQLSVTILSAFCRVADIAASQDMVKKIPLVLDIMTKESASPFLEECYEFLLLVSASSEDGASTLCESEVLKVVAKQMPNLSDGSRLLEMSLRLTLLFFSKAPLDVIISCYSTEVCAIVAPIARQFAVLQDALKFELLHLLYIILASNCLGHLRTFNAMPNSNWAAYIRTGIIEILQNRVAPDQKWQAIAVAESVVSLVGANWLISQIDIPGTSNSVPSDRCLLLVLETSRVEVAVLLNDLAYLKYEASSSKGEEIPIKQRTLGVAFSLIETIIKLVSTASESEGGVISDSTIIKIISGLDETMGVVFEYLKDAKEHGQGKGDDLLACVRVIGSYLAESPLACQDKVNELLGDMLLIEGDDEPSPFLSVCFLLPMLCQTTMKIEGSKLLVSSGGYRVVVQCLVRLISSAPKGTEDNGDIFLACDTILNLLLKREQIRLQLDESVFIQLLKNLAYWADKTKDVSVIMMASSICSLVLDILSEEVLLRYPEFDSGALDSLSHVIAKSMATCGEEMCDDTSSDADLHEIISAGYSRWADRFPWIRRAVEG